MKETKDRDQYAEPSQEIEYQRLQLPEGIGLATTIRGHSHHKTCREPAKYHPTLLRPNMVGAPMSTVYPTTARSITNERSLKLCVFSAQ